jgi:hypothetical protein
MSLQDDLSTVQRRLDDLNRAVSQLEQHVGGGNVDMRRVRADTDHLREDLALLQQSAPQGGAAKSRPEMVPIPDAPYDRALWSGAEDEGLGSPYGHAP